MVWWRHHAAAAALVLLLLQELPSKITDATKSDVDICIVADGVNITVAQRHANDVDNASSSDGSVAAAVVRAEPTKSFVTTCSQFTSAIRFGCKDLSQFCKAAGVRSARTQTTHTLRARECCRRAHACEVPSHRQLG